MATTFTTPNMGLVLPVVGQELGPQWATDLFVSLSTTLDQHNHTPGKGVQVPTAGININADLGFGSFNVTALRSSRYTNQGSPLALGPDVGCTYVSGGELWYNDTSSRQVQLTKLGSANFAFLSYPERTPAISGNFTILSTDLFSLYYVDTSGGVSTNNLPASSAVSVGRTYLFDDIKRNAGTNSITLVPNGADKINGVAGNYVVSSSGSLTVVTTDGAGNWYAHTVAGTTFDPLNIATNLQWIAAQANPILTQAGTGPANGTAQSIGLSPQLANATNGTPGNVLSKLSAPTGTGSYPFFQVTLPGGPLSQIGPYNNATASTALWLLPFTTAPATGNYLMRSDGVGVRIQSPTNSGGSIFFQFGDATSCFTADNSGGANSLNFFGTSADYGGGTNILRIGNAATPPASNATSAGLMYAQAGAGKWRGSGGAIATFGVAGESAQNTQAGILDDRLSFARTTASGATFTVDTAVASTTNLYIRVSVTGRLVSGTGAVGDSIRLQREALFRNVAGTLTKVSEQQISAAMGDANMTGTTTIAFSVSGTNARLTITSTTGEGATPTIDWQTKIDTEVV